MNILSLNNVSISSNKKNHLLLDNANCDIKRGEILGIIGPNGAGKSTLIAAISNDISYSGNIVINGEADTPSLRARQVAVLPQLSLLNFPFRVFEVVNLARIPHQTGAQLDTEIIDQALKMMDIGFLKNRLYTELSGGEKQRVQLARAFAQIWREQDSPNGQRLLLLDEPTTALDLGHQQDLMNAVKQFAKQGVAVAMVLHDINLASRYCDKLLALLRSKTLAYGTVNKVITPENIKRLFSIETQIISHPIHNTPIVIGL